MPPRTPEAPRQSAQTHWHFSPRPLTRCLSATCLRYRLQIELALARVIDAPAATRTRGGLCARLRGVECLGPHLPLRFVGALLFDGVGEKLRRHLHPRGRRAAPPAHA